LTNGRGIQQIALHPHATIPAAPRTEGLNLRVDSIYNGWRMEEVSFDK
jgi:hypothetical protein